MGTHAGVCKRPARHLPPPGPPPLFFPPACCHEAMLPRCEQLYTMTPLCLAASCLTLVILFVFYVRTCSNCLGCAHGASPDHNGSAPLTGAYCTVRLTSPKNGSVTHRYTVAHVSLPVSHSLACSSSRHAGVAHQSLAAASGGGRSDGRSGSAAVNSAMFFHGS